MVPWVVLYAVSGFMFNHPHWFALEDDNVASVVLVVPEARWTPPIPSDLGQQVVTALNGRDSSGARLYRLETSHIRLSAPVLSLSAVTDHGDRRLILYNLQTGATEVHALPTSPGTTQFLTQLHKSREYPEAGTRSEAFQGVRIIRAVFVDAMATVLVFWGASGVTMWLQHKGLRRTGFAVLGVSLVVTTLICWGMHGYFVRAR